MNDNDLLPTVAKAAEAMGLSEFAIAAMKKAGIHCGDSAWSGRYTTRKKMRDWIDRHSEFVASHQYPKKEKEEQSGKPEPTCTPKGRRSSASGKSRAPARKSAPRTASPAGSAHPPALAA
ncbi:MAG: hypothetical protein K0R17_1035 [Rariglobus sp.]|nr:hypothetical protein [Rariglobus sp.]